MFIRYAQSEKIGNLNNLKVVGIKNAKGLKVQDSLTGLRPPIPERGVP